MLVTNVPHTNKQQVITGGQYDVDVELISPTKQVLYSQAKAQYDSHTFIADVSPLSDRLHPIALTQFSARSRSAARHLFRLLQQ